MRTVIPWAIAGVLALGLGLQWRSAEEARSRVAAVQSAAEEMSTLYLEQSEQYARWLTAGLRDLRVGNSEEGFRALDTLLATTARTLRPGTPELEAAEAYLDDVGDPWKR
jgi:hypothetical protein